MKKLTKTYYIVFQKAEPEYPCKVFYNKEDADKYAESWAGFVTECEGMNDYLQGVISSIEILRDLQDTRGHLSEWSHSRDLKFAPVELSDYILRKCIK